MVSTKQLTSKKTKKDKPLKQGKINKKKPLKEKVEKLIKAKESEPKQKIEKAKSEDGTKNKVKYMLPSKSVTENLVEQCLTTLEKLAAHDKKKNTLLEDETIIFAEIHCIKIQNTRGNVRIVLPHSTAASTGEICLITPDLKKGKKIDHEPTIDHWEEILRKAGVTNVKTILPLRQLKVEYDQYELKRRLLTQHDFIMVDTRVLNPASHILGKMFFKKHNMLIPVRVDEKADIKKDIDIGLRTAMLRLNIGHTSTIQVGHTGMARKELKANVLALVKQLREKYPGGEVNIRSISLKLPKSLALPLYLTLRPSSVVNAPKMTQNRPKHFAVLEDELSTIPGGRVTVAPDGTVHLKKSNDMDISEGEDNEEEEDVESDTGNKSE